MKDQLPQHKLLVFTGPIDAYFAAQGMPKLEYRSINFEVIANQWTNVVQHVEVAEPFCNNVKMKCSRVDVFKCMLTL